ncbi:unnamed protein product [Rhizophagus irregularis]|nr:unnamed protein product [Rhizophagus irregularis]CAB5362838.1 unnamed protein product [Rhizophagus irregularis]
MSQENETAELKRKRTSVYEIRSVYDKRVKTTNSPDESSNKQVETFQYWLMKAEPNSRIVKGKDVKFSIDDLADMPDGVSQWDGVRNYEARNIMRDKMKVKDKVLFYHSNCKTPGLAGLAEIVKEAYPDYTAFDESHPYYDPKSNKDNPRWFMVDIKFVRKFKRFITLKELQAHKDKLMDMVLLNRGRLSLITKVVRHVNHPIKNDYITLTGAKGSNTPNIIIPEFLYLGDAKTARWFPHLLSNKITHVINLSGGSNYWETEEKILKFLDQQKKQIKDSEQSLKKSNDSSNESNEIGDKVIDNGIVVIGKAVDNKFIDKAVENEINDKVVDNEIVPLRYLKINITDDPSSNISKHFHECIDFIENAKSTNGRVYVHCLAGISRSTSIVIAYLMNSQKIHYNQAFNLVKEKRPNVKPNQGFVEQLRKFEKTVVARHHCD